MAIVKMKAVTIAGPIEDFDSVVEKYVYGRDIHLENAMSVLTNKGRLVPFEENSGYDIIARDAAEILKLADYAVNKKIVAPESMTADDMQRLIDDTKQSIEAEQKQSGELQSLITQNEAVISEMNLMPDTEVELTRLQSLEFIDCKFGRIPRAGYKTLTTYLDTLEAFFIKTAEDDTDVWGFCFSPVSAVRRIEEVFNSLYFEQVELPSGYEGTPREIKQRLTEKNKQLKLQISELRTRTASIISDAADKLCGVYNLAVKRHQFAEVRRSAVHGDMFFYIVGWMSEKKALSLEKEITASGGSVMFYLEDAQSVTTMEPPTKLKNNKLIRPFEMFVKMYGLPSYNEIDPTPILAVTYILFFGIMFGDFGQGLVLSIAGFIVYKLKKWDLGGIVAAVGLSGAVFGIVYGSFFGNEEIIPALLHTTALRPMEQITFMLGGTIAMGMFIIIFGMVLNVINSLRRRDWGEALFGHNGIAGLVFYVGILLLIANMFLKWGIPTSVFAVAIAVSIVAMYMTEPLGKLVKGQKNWFPKDGIYFVENLFELFEVVLSFFTNTISFLRIGAFAIIHVGMMTAVSILAGSGGIGSVAVQIIGNIVVMLLEGLIVGIQVLRLEYYEMFSRYFTGRGKEFVSLREK